MTEPMKTVYLEGGPKDKEFYSTYLGTRRLETTTGYYEHVEGTPMKVWTWHPYEDGTSRGLL